MSENTVIVQHFQLYVFLLLETLPDMCLIFSLSKTELELLTGQLNQRSDRVMKRVKKDIYRLWILFSFHLLKPYQWKQHSMWKNMLCVWVSEYICVFAPLIPLLYFKQLWDISQERLICLRASVPVCEICFIVFHFLYWILHILTSKMLPYDESTTCVLQITRVASFEAKVNVI